MKTKIIKTVIFVLWTINNLNAVLKICGCGPRGWSNIINDNAIIFYPYLAIYLLGIYAISKLNFEKGKILFSLIIIIAGLIYSLVAVQFARGLLCACSNSF